MNEQTITQTIHITYGDLASTGSPFLLALLATLVLLAFGLTLFLLRNHLTPRIAFTTHSLRSRINTTPFRILSLFLALGLLLTHNLSPALAAPTLTLASNQQNLTISIPEASTTAGTTTAEATTTLTTSTVNETGYTLTASLTEQEPGIGIELKGGEVTDFQALEAGESSTVLTLATTDVANDPDSSDPNHHNTTDITLKFTVDSSVTPGTKELKLTYRAVDNEAAEPEEPMTPPAPLTMQTMTSTYCTDHMEVYDGTNEEAILTLSDPRGEGATYQVAKLADENCWMLDNLRLGSTMNPITLTSEDTDIENDTIFTIPKLYDGTIEWGDDYYWDDTYKSIDPNDDDGSYSDDYPRTYGPVPGDTGEGETNYGYLYNWSAATAGETRTSHDETAGDAQYSICPVNWRLPTGGINNTDDWMPKDTSDFNILNARMAGFASTTDPAYLAVIDDPWQGSWPTLHFLQANWLHNGPFKGVFAGGWGGWFFDQSGWGGLWSASANLTGPYSAFFAYASPYIVGPGYDYHNRSTGFGVRCLISTEDR